MYVFSLLYKTHFLFHLFFCPCGLRRTSASYWLVAIYSCRDLFLCLAHLPRTPHHYNTYLNQTVKGVRSAISSIVAVIVSFQIPHTGIFFNPLANRFLKNGKAFDAGSSRGALSAYMPHKPWPRGNSRLTHASEREASPNAPVLPRPYKAKTRRVFIALLFFYDVGFILYAPQSSPSLHSKPLAQRPCGKRGGASAAATITVAAMGSAVRGVSLYSPPPPQ